jgi:hypothetical protein
MELGCEVGGIGLGSFPVASYGIRSVEPSGFAVTVLIG